MQVNERDRQQAPPLTLRVGVTGSEGLIGASLCSALQLSGYEVQRFDLARRPEEDVRNPESVTRWAMSCDGVVHLAAITRLAWAERDPEECWRTNVGGTANVLRAVTRQSSKPWIVFASSREVYGNAVHLPVKESAPLAPINHYARSKVEAERLVRAAVNQGATGAILRFSNVYGSVHDHSDRVIPAFARAAAGGDDLSLEGGFQTLDFTHVEDVVRGILQVLRRMASGEPPDGPVHFVSGRGTRLSDLAMHALRAAGTRSRVIQHEPQPFHIEAFVGDPTRARRVLDWGVQIHVEEGLTRLVNEFRQSHPARVP